MKVLMLWADQTSANLGVRVLAEGSTDLIRRIWPEAVITYQNFGSRIPQLPVGSIQSLLRERATGKRKMMDWISEFELVFDTRSGDSFSDIYGVRRLGIMTMVSEFVAQAGVPLVLGPQTIGPFQSVIGRRMARRSLNQAELVMTRDSVSASCAMSLGRSADVVTSDVVFALPVPQVNKTRDVILNISGLLWAPNPHVDYLVYRDTVRRLYVSLGSDGRQVSILAHVLESLNSDNDVKAIYEFLSASSDTAEVVIPSSLMEVREVVASAKLVIGSRMHACLNAISVGTPAIGLAYSRKFSSLFEDLGWHSTVDLRTDPDSVKSVLDIASNREMSGSVRSVVDRAHSALVEAEVALQKLR